MTQLTYQQIMNRVGSVLLIAGLLDLLFSLWQATTSGHFVIKFNLLAILCGVFLLKGSLRAAWVTRWLAVISLVAITGNVLLLPLGEPVALTLAKFRLMTADMLMATGFVAALLVLAVWVMRQLGKAPVRAATEESGGKWRGNLVPAVLGMAVVAVMGVGVVQGLSGEGPQRAMRMAAQQHGNAFQYTTSWYSVTRSSSGVTSRRAVVTAWNDKEIRFVNVGWDE